MAKTLLLLLLSLIFFSLSFSLSSFTHPSSPTFPDAMEILSNSGYLSMALTLQLISQPHMPNFSNATIFAPSDVAFVRSGQPSLLLLQYHISPIRFSIADLKALPYGTKIPTLQSQNPLIVTSSNYNGEFLINDVKINESPIFDDGSVAVYGMDQFFKSSSFAESPNLAPGSYPNSPIGPAGDAPIAKEPSGVGVDFLGMVSDSLVKTSDMLRSGGYSKMATFLDLQLVGFNDETKLTIFAPLDEEIDEYVKNFSDYSLIFRKHVVPSLLTWKDLVGLDDESMLPTFSVGFMISVAKSGDVLVLNGVPVIFPDMYNSDSIVVHGVSQLLIPPSTNQQSMGDSFSVLGGYNEGNSLDYGEY